jgi:hypothetical protein
VWTGAAVANASSRCLPTLDGFSTKRLLKNYNHYPASDWWCEADFATVIAPAGHSSILDGWNDTIVAVSSVGILRMFRALIVLVSSGIAAFGVVVMRNPMHLALLAPGAEGFYQRMVLDRVQRHQLRMLGMIASFFGLAVLTSILGGLLRIRVLQNVSSGMLALLWVSFIAAFGFGVIYSIFLLVQGRGKELFLGTFRMWRQGMQLGPIDLDPAITPRMRTETTVFTVVYCLLVALAFVIALVF